MGEQLPCTPKTGSYATGAIARRELAKIRRGRRGKREEAETPKRAYYCTRCGRHHLTSQDWK